MLPSHRPSRILAVTVASATVIAVGPGCISSDPAADRLRVDEIAESRLEDRFDAEDVARAPVLPPPAWNFVDPLDVETAVRVAFQRDAKIRTALAELDLARAELAQADLPPNPAVDLAIGVAIDGMSGAPAIAGVTQQLTWIWTRDARVDAHDAARRAAILEAAGSMIALDAEVRRLHTAVVAGDALYELDAAHAEATRRTVETVASIVEVGEASRVDLDRALVDAAESAAAATAARSDARRARLELLTAMGCPDQDPAFEAIGTLDRNQPIPDESRIVELARSVRLDVAAARMGVVEAEAGHRLAGAARWPEVGVGAAWNRNFVDREAVLPGARVTIPILDDGSTQVAAARARLDAARLRLLDVRRDAIGTARSTREALVRSNRRCADYAETVLEPALEAERLAESAYREGVIDLTVLLLAQQRRVEVERRLVEYRLASQVERITLEEAVGGSFDLDPIPPAVPGIDEASKTALVEPRLQAGRTTMEFSS